MEGDETGTWVNTNSANAGKPKMKRRSLLKGIAAGALHFLAWRNLPIVARTKLGLGRVRPSDSQWPSAANWSKLNQAVEGNLLRPEGLLAPCETERNSVACAEGMQNLRKPFYLGDHVA